MAVAPYAGAWIEIDYGVTKFTETESHPTRVRGLKSQQDLSSWLSLQSHPTRVRGLKCQAWDFQQYQGSVAPYAGAWIEIVRTYSAVTIERSHPTRVRGLKFLQASCILYGYSRTLRGCVD